MLRDADDICVVDRFEQQLEAVVLSNDGNVPKEDVNKAIGYLDRYCDEDYPLWTCRALTETKMTNIGTILVKV